MKLRIKVNTKWDKQRPSKKKAKRAYDKECFRKRDYPRILDDFWTIKI